MKNQKTNIVTSRYNSSSIVIFLWLRKKIYVYKVNKNLTSDPRHPLWRVPWATIFYVFQHNKNGKIEGLFDTMLFKLMKK